MGYALGMFGAFLAVLVNFLSLVASPIESLVLIVLDFAIIFLLAVDFE